MDLDDQNSADEFFLHVRVAVHPVRTEGGKDCADRVDCDTDMEKELIGRILSMDLDDQILNAEAKSDGGSDQEINQEAASLSRRSSMINHWVDQAKQDEDSLGLEGLRRIQPYGPLGLDGSAEPATFHPLGQESSATPSLQLQPQAPPRFQPSLSTLLQPGNCLLSHQTQQTSHPNQGVGPTANDMNVYVHPYPIGRSSRKPARSPPQMHSLVTNSNITRLPPQMSPPQDPDTYSMFGDGFTSNPDSHPSCTGDSRDGRTTYGKGDWRDSRPMYVENGRRNSWYNSREPTFNSGSLSQYQESSSQASASENSSLGNGFQPFSTGRSEDGDRTRSQSLGGGMRPTLVGQPGVARYNGGRRYSGNGGSRNKFCNFCKTNGESSSVYLNHNIGAPG